MSLITSETVPAFRGGFGEIMTFDVSFSVFLRSPEFHRLLFSFFFCSFFFFFFFSIFHFSFSGLTKPNSENGKNNKIK